MGNFFVIFDFVVYDVDYRTESDVINSFSVVGKSKSAFFALKSLVVLQHHM
jgi:hypothetical protein